MKKKNNVWIPIAIAVLVLFVGSFFLIEGNITGEAFKFFKKAGYCQSKYIYSEKTDKTGCPVGKRTGFDLNGSKIYKGYSCETPQFPTNLKATACPKGTHGDFYSLFKYRCTQSYGEEQVKSAKCISGYKVNSVEKYNLLGENPNAINSFECISNIYSPPGMAIDPNIPCGKSGAKFGLYGMIGGYCCIYPD